MDKGILSITVAKLMFTEQPFIFTMRMLVSMTTLQTVHDEVFSVECSHPVDFINLLQEAKQTIFLLLYIF